MWGSELRGDALKKREVGLGLRQVSFKSWLCPWAPGGPWASCVTFLIPGPHLLRDLSGQSPVCLKSWATWHKLFLNSWLYFPVLGLVYSSISRHFQVKKAQEVRRLLWMFYGVLKLRKKFTWKGIWGLEKEIARRILFKNAVVRCLKISLFYVPRLFQTSSIFRLLRHHFIYFSL